MVEVRQIVLVLTQEELESLQKFLSKQYINYEDGSLITVVRKIRDHIITDNDPGDENDSQERITQEQVDEFSNNKNDWGV